MGDPKRRLVEDDIAAADQPAHQHGVADVALDQGHPAARQRGGEIADAAAHHVVDHGHLADAFAEQQVDDMRADEAGAAGDQNPGTTQISHPHLPSATLAGTSASSPPAATRLTASITRAVSAVVSSGKSGSDSVSRDSASVSGRSPAR